MDQVRERAGGPEAWRPAVSIVRVVLRATLWILPLLALRAMLWPREQALSDLSDRELADVGLSRADVTRPHERTASAELEMQRLLRGRDWR